MSDRRPPGLAGPDALDREAVLGAVEACVRLSEVVPGSYEGPNVVLPGYERLFGGQLLAQALAAGLATDDSGKVPRSLHLVFTAEGRPDAPVLWSVGRVHSGATFATRTVSATQADRLLASGVVSLHRLGDAGPDHGIRPPQVEEPATLEDVPQLGAMALEVRSAGNVPLDGVAVGPPELAVWMRLPGGYELAPGDAGAHEEILAYSSDLTMMAAALRPHEGLGFGTSSLIGSAVTSHTISFHRPVSVADWLLFAQSSPVAAGGRAFVRGDWFTRAGELVASCAQEVFLKVAAELR